ncbi:MAG: succinylglutamate desuccinylase [Nitrospirales bacterium]|nr:MAG: succinylglutamate desuccinylase [Nitrospirales bacterium]
MANTQRQAFEIGGTSVQPGTRKTINLSMSLLSNHAPMDIPVHVIHGKKDGARLFMSAAIHGDELNGVEIIRRVLKVPRLNTLRGTLIAVPIVNVFGFLAHSRYLPDRRDLNRSFPGNEKGSLTSQLANVFMKEVVLRCTHGIDLHTGAIHRSNLPQIRADLTDPNMEALTKSFSAPLILHSNLRDGSLRRAATDKHIPTMLYEAGEALRFDEFAIRLGVKGILRVMQTLAMIGKSPPPIQTKSVVSMTSYWLRAPIGGILRSLHPLGARVECGDHVGTIADPMGEMETAVIAGESGILIGRSNLPVVNQGDALFHVAKVKNVTTAEKVVEKFHEKFKEEIQLDNSIG